MQAEDAIFLAGLCSRIRQWLASVGLAFVLPYSSVSPSLLVVSCPGRTASVELEAGPPRSDRAGHLWCLGFLISETCWLVPDLPSYHAVVVRL